MLLFKFNHLLDYFIHILPPLACKIAMQFVDLLVGQLFRLSHQECSYIIYWLDCCEFDDHLI